MLVKSESELRTRALPSSAHPAISDFFARLNASTLTAARKHRRLSRARQATRGDDLEDIITSCDACIISVSHFVPQPDKLHQGLEAFLPVMGSRALSRQIASLRSRVHVFGHCRHDVDELVDGTRYLQAGGAGFPPTPVLAWATEAGVYGADPGALG